MLFGQRGNQRQFHLQQMELAREGRLVNDGEEGQDGEEEEEEEEEREEQQRRVRHLVESVWSGLPLRRVVPYTIDRNTRARSAASDDATFSVSSQAAVGGALYVIGRGALSRAGAENVSPAAAGEGSMVPKSGRDQANGLSVVLRSERAAKAAAEATLPPVWTSDDAAASCVLCGSTFAVLRRRHHCRNCGNAICDSCSSK